MGGDNEEEILRISYQLANRELYDAAHLICSLARQRDESKAHSPHVGR